MRNAKREDNRFSEDFNKLPRGKLREKRNYNRTERE